MLLALSLLLGAASSAHRSELWTREQELEAQRLGLVDLSEHVTSPRPHEWLRAEAIPAEFTWKNVSGINYLTKSLNQHIPQYCGSCWAHGTLSALADRIKISRMSQGRDGIDINLSVQHLLNCGNAGSCHGGTGGGVYNWIKNNSGGIAFDTCQPYLACSHESSEGFCKAAGLLNNNWTCDAANICRTCATFGKQCVGLDHYPNATVNETGGTPGLELPPPKGNAAMMQAEIFARGPIACTVYADAAMDDYTGGILNGGDEGMPNHVGFIPLAKCLTQFEHTFRTDLRSAIHHCLAVFCSSSHHDLLFCRSYR